MRHTVALLFWFVFVLWADITPCPFEADGKMRTGRFKALGALCLTDRHIGGLPFEGISDLAYDALSRHLYMISDTAVLFDFNVSSRPLALRPLAGYRLRDKNGFPIRSKSDGDTEGMTLTPKGLAVSFERKPKVVLYTPNGKRLKKLKLPKPLRRAKHYRDANKMLEAVAYHPRYGLLLAPELPLKGHKHPRLYAKKKQWKLPGKLPITALSVTPEGDILILRRRYEGFFKGYTVALDLLHPKNGNVERIARLQSKEGWPLENFEGLTRVGKETYLMVSDNNGNPFTPTVLVYFRLLPPRSR